MFSAQCICTRYMMVARRQDKIALVIQGRNQITRQRGGNIDQEKQATGPAKASRANGKRTYVEHLYDDIGSTKATPASPYTPQQWPVTLTLFVHNGLGRLPRHPCIRVQVFRVLASDPAWRCRRRHHGRNAPSTSTPPFLFLAGRYLQCVRIAEPMYRPATVWKMWRCSTIGAFAWNEG